MVSPTSGLSAASNGRTARESASRPSTMVRAARRLGVIARVWSAPRREVKRSGETGDIGQVAVVLLGVEAVADHEDVGNLPSHIVQGDVGGSLATLGHEGARLDGGGSSGVKIPQEVGKAEAARADAFDHEHILALEGLVEILTDPHHPGGGDLPVGHHGDEVHGGGYAERAEEIREKDGGAFEDSHQMKRLVRVVCRDLRGEPCHLDPDRLLVEQRLAYSIADGRHHANRVAFTNSRDCSMAAASTRPEPSHSSRHCEMVRTECRV